MTLEIIFKQNLLKNFIRIQNEGFKVMVIDETKIEIYNIEAFGLDPDYDEEHALLMFKDNEEQYSRIPVEDVLSYQLYREEEE